MFIITPNWHTPAIRPLFVERVLHARLHQTIEEATFTGLGIGNGPNIVQRLLESTTHNRRGLSEKPVEARRIASNAPRARVVLTPVYSD